jgi:hypothetical protein
MRTTLAANSGNGDFLSGGGTVGAFAFAGERVTRMRSETMMRAKFIGRQSHGIVMPAQVQ